MVVRNNKDEYDSHSLYILDAMCSVNNIVIS